MKTENEIREKLAAAVAEAGGYRAFADAHGMTASHVHDVVHGRRGIGPKILEALSLRAVVRYARQR